MNSYEDLFYILAANEALRAGPYMNTLYVSCFFGQRSDKRTIPAAPISLKIIADIINACKFYRVQVLHPHSDVLPALVDRCFVVGNDELVQYALNELDTNSKNLLLVTTDANSYKQNEKYAKRYGCDLISANKSRYKGEIIQDLSVDIWRISGRTCIMVDDYIDGGRTFIGLAKKLKELGAAQVILIGTHGLFSYGFDLEGVDRIFTTNSIQDITHEKITQINVMG
jgi:ribose-phosphate pyrophosphokinase